MFSGPSSYADSVDFAMLFIVGVSVFFLVGIVIAMIYFVIRYSRKRNPVATQIHGNTALEIVWIIIPFLITMAMFWLGWKDYSDMRKSADAAMTIKVTGQMWKWTFEYPNGKKADTLYVPVDKTIKLELKSMDVNHAFFIPAFRIKEDVIASRTTYMVIKPEKKGAYEIACAEYCGLKHAYMYTKLHVVDMADYEAWISNGTKNTADTNKPKTTAENIDPVKFADKISSHKNFNLLMKNGCLACHSVDGSKKIGPSFANLANKKTKIERDGKQIEIKVDENYLKNSIINPDADVVVGYQKYMMPTMKDRINEKELNEIVNLLKGDS